MATRIIALWAVPRSVSTPFERMFAERDDTTVVHEPFTECFYFSDGRASARYGDAPEFASYDGARAVDEIRRAAAAGPGGVRTTPAPPAPPAGAPRAPRPPPATAGPPSGTVDGAREPMYRRALEVYERIAPNAL